MVQAAMVDSVQKKTYNADVNRWQIKFNCKPVKMLKCYVLL